MEERHDITGYPYIDKPWEAYYKESKVSDIKRSIYEEVLENNFCYPNDLASEYFTAKINYQKFFEIVQKAARSLKEYGVKKGDFVTICSLGTPEVVYMFYAVSMIGAIANMITPFFGTEEGLINRINACESKLLIVMDKFYPSLENSIKKTNIENVVVVPMFNATLLRFFTKKYKLQRNGSELFWNQFLKDGKNQRTISCAPYEPNMPVAMMCTSASTSKNPKAVLLSNDSIQNSIRAYPSLGVNLTRQQKFYQTIPPWCSTGLITCIHLPLAYGTTVLMDPRCERKTFVKNIVKKRPNYVVGTTSMYEGFLDKSLVKNADLSHLEYPFEGGEPLSPDVSHQIDEIFRKHNCKASLGAAYGQCECGAAITSQTFNFGNGSVGIPIPGVTVNAFDDETNPLKYNEKGNIYVDTPCHMLEYYADPEKTRNYFYLDKDRIWCKTGDVGYVNENGELFILGRESDTTVINGTKIYNFDIENIIMSLEEIKMCDVLSMNIDGEETLTVHIIFKDEYTFDNDTLINKLKDVQELIYEETKNIDMVPYIFKIRKNFPVSKGSKRNIAQMKNETDGFIYLDKYAKPKAKKIGGMTCN